MYYFRNPKEKRRQSNMRDNTAQERALGLVNSRPAPAQLLADRC